MPERGQLAAQLELLVVVAGTERDVMNRSRAHCPAPDPGYAPQVDDGARSAVAARVPIDASLFAHESESERVGEQLSRQLAHVQPEGDGVKAANGMLGWNSGSRPARKRVGSGVGNELPHQSVVVLERDDTLVLVTRDGLSELHLLTDHPLDPESNRAGPNDEGDYRDLPAALSSPARIGPGEEGEDAPWASEVVTEVEMVGGGIVEID